MELLGVPVSPSKLLRDNDINPSKNQLPEISPSNEISPSKMRRHKGEGSGSIHWQIITKNGRVKRSHFSNTAAFTSPLPTNQPEKTAIAGATNAHIGLHQVMHELRHGSVNEAKQLLARQIAGESQCADAAVVLQVPQEV